MMHMDMTDTWLTETMHTEGGLDHSETCAHRMKVKEGGTATCVHSKLDSNQLTKIIHKNYEQNPVNIPAIKTTNIVTYRPTDNPKKLT